jgi:hypothetical protein
LQIEWNPWLGASAPRSPFCLPSVLNWICWNPPPARKKIFLGTPLHYMDCGLLGVIPCQVNQNSSTFGPDPLGFFFQIRLITSITEDK